MQFESRIRSALAAVFCCASALFSLGLLTGCLEAQQSNRPPVEATKPASNPNQYQPQPGAASPTTSTAPNAGRTGVGCTSADAEEVPNEPGLRECCRKINPQMTACLGSACWGPGFASKIKVHMVAGGRCAP